MTDVDSAVAGGTETDQKREGTHKEHFAKITDAFRQLEDMGAADGPRFKALCFTLLKSFEGVRLQQEGMIKDYERKIEFCRATQQSCSMFSNLLVGMLGTQVQEAKTGIAPAPEVGGRVSDKEMLKRICICGCVDEEDAANCDCSCHEGTPCDDERCVVCQAKKVQATHEETSGRRKPPTPKKVTKKKAVRKKKAAKKKATKKAT